uniref:Polysaccharide export protein N-terminal domain-containing protein n=1 Tax=uncultured Armatimonadetes bacterium TaxID=157466 RepID=A0A6J4K8I4_9BACT|nr:hypothetical protein AVDCRST_MAG63-5046 [uncultured Armatimonadetes bacterium]
MTTYRRHHPAALAAALGLLAAALPAPAARAQAQVQAPEAPQPPPPAASGEVPDAIASVPADYRLDIGDTVNITVSRHGDVGGTWLIPVDGMLRLNRLKAPVYAPGKTCAELGRELASGWSHQFRLKPGQVTVSVATQRMRHIYVRGNAIKSGNYNLQPNWRLSELVTYAGMPSVPVDRVTVLVTNGRRPKSPIRVDLDAALNVPGSPENLALLEGDTVTVDTARTLRLLIAGQGPKGQHEVYRTYGLRRALTVLQYSVAGADGSLREARIIRKRDPEDVNSPEEVIPVDLVRLMQHQSEEIPLRDQDLLYIPPSERYVYIFGEANGSRKQMMPEDRKTYLVDVIAAGGGTTGQAKIGQIGILREVNGKTEKITVDFGKYLQTQEARYNPEILPKDIVYVPKASRVSTGYIWEGMGLFNMLKSFFRL